MSFISESITELLDNYTTVCFEALTIGTNFLEESYDDEDSLARQALEELIENCRNEVSCALIEELGENMLFVSMWLTVE